MSISRRGFLKSFTAIAALAVVPDTLLPLPQTDQERLIELMKTGRLENQLFELDGPIIFDVEYLTIYNCTFLFKCPTKMQYAIAIKTTSLVLDSCYIDCGKNGAEAVIYIDNSSPTSFTLVSHNMVKF